MNQDIKQDLMDVVRSGKKIIDAGDSAALKELSDHTIHNASIFQDQYSVSIAVIFYALSKLMERGRLNTKKVLQLLEEAEKNIRENNDEGYNKRIKDIFSFISGVDSKLKLYVEEVINQAQIKKSSKMYAHGISLAHAASVLGISQWELIS